MSEIFDKMAVHYDSPQRLFVAQQIITEIKRQLTLPQSSILLEYGCGTGVIGLALAPYFDKVILADSSANMLSIVNDKIQQQQLKHVVTQQVTTPQSLTCKVDTMIVSQTLLHIPDTIEMLKQCYQQLNDAGQLIIIDFIKNDQVYHELVHNGFDLPQLSQQLVDIGFSVDKHHIFYEAPNLFMNQHAQMFYLCAKK